MVNSPGHLSTRGTHRLLNCLLHVQLDVRIIPNLGLAEYKQNIKLRRAGGGWGWIRLRERIVAYTRPKHPMDQREGSNGGTHRIGRGVTNSTRVSNPISPKTEKYIYIYITSECKCKSRILYRRYFQHAHFIPVVGVGKRGAYQLFHSNLPRQHSFGTTLRFTGPVSADSWQ